MTDMLGAGVGDGSLGGGDLFGGGDTTGLGDLGGGLFGDGGGGDLFGGGFGGDGGFPGLGSGFDMFGYDPTGGLGASAAVTGDYSGTAGQGGPDAIGGAQSDGGGYQGPTGGNQQLSQLFNQASQQQQPQQPQTPPQPPDPYAFAPNDPRAPAGPIGYQEASAAESDAPQPGGGQSPVVTQTQNGSNLYAPKPVNTISYPPSSAVPPNQPGSTVLQPTPVQTQTITPFGQTTPFPSYPSDTGYGALTTPDQAQPATQAPAPAPAPTPSQTQTPTPPAAGGTQPTPANAGGAAPGQSQTPSSGPGKAAGVPLQRLVGDLMQAIMGNPQSLLRDLMGGQLGGMLPGPQGQQAAGAPAFPGQTVRGLDGNYYRINRGGSYTRVPAPSQPSPSQPAQTPSVVAPRSEDEPPAAPAPATPTTPPTPPLPPPQDAASEDWRQSYPQNLTPPSQRPSAADQPPPQTGADVKAMQQGMQEGAQQQPGSTPSPSQHFRAGRTSAPPPAPGLPQPQSVGAVNGRGRSGFIPALAQDRAGYARTIAANPQLHNRILQIMYNEQGANPRGTQAVAESLLNRASVRGQSLEQVARWHRLESGGYYQPGQGPRFNPAANPRVTRILNQSLSNALAGSDISGLATDNSSNAGGSNLAARERASGSFSYRSGYNGESFFTPGSAEPGLVSRWVNWVNRLNRMAAQ